VEIIVIDKDINLIYEQAVSFPDGVKPAHEKIHSLFPFTSKRKYFGVSRPENGIIIYKAAVEEIAQGEAEKFGLPIMTLKKGNYISTVIHDFMKDIPAIGQTFQELLAHPEIDPQGYCVEWYFNLNDVRCMVRLNNNFNS
jgi:hypothetical protein